MVRVLGVRVATQHISCRGPSAPVHEGRLGLRGASAIRTGSASVYLAACAAASVAGRALAGSSGFTAGFPVRFSSWVFLPARPVFPPGFRAGFPADFSARREEEEAVERAEVVEENEVEERRECAWG